MKPRFRYVALADNGAVRHADRIADAFRDAGVKVRSYNEFETLFQTESQADVPPFCFACVETGGNKRLIDSLLRDYAYVVREVDRRTSAWLDHNHSVLSKVFRIRGIRSVDASELPVPTGDGGVVDDLGAMTGTACLDGVGGQLLGRDREHVYIRYDVRDMDCRTEHRYAQVPLAECPALYKAEADVVAGSSLEDDSTLREYQIEMKSRVIEAWGRYRSVMLQMPTGTGKTRLFVSLIRDIRAADGTARVLIVTHRAELVEQVSSSLHNHYHIEHGILQGAATCHTDRHVIVSSIQSLARKGRVADIALHFDFIIIDEAHHSLAASYRNLWRRYPDAKMLGVTATPCRLKRASFGTLYGTLIEAWPMRRFVEEDYLSGYRLYTVSSQRAALQRLNRLKAFAPDGDYKAQDLDDIVNCDSEAAFIAGCHEAYAQGRRGIVYAVNRSHAQRIASLLVANGVRAVPIDCSTPAAERKRLIDGFRHGKVEVLVNVDLFSEGFDCPSIGFVILARPTLSLALYMQQVGRALRPSPDGSDVLILDCVGLHHRFGLPDKKHDWQALFWGRIPAGSDYCKRQLGSMSACMGLMAEVERRRLELLPSDTGVHVCRNVHGLYGLCGSDGSIIVRPVYREVSDTGYGWYKAEPNAASGTVRLPTAILLPSTGQVLNVWDMSEAPDGFTGEIECGGSRYKCRFDRNLSFVGAQETVMEGVRVYVHNVGTTTYYTLSLHLGAVIYRTVSRWCAGWLALNAGGSSCAMASDNCLADAYTDQLLLSGHRYIMTKGGLYIGDNGCVAKHVDGGFPILYSRTPTGYTVYDEGMNKILSADDIIIRYDSMTILRKDMKPHKLDFMRYALYGEV